MSPERVPKILVIGSEGHAGVTWTGWLDEEIPNIADFDAVIVNTASLTTIIGEWERQTPPLDKWDALYDRLRSVKERLFQVVRSEGVVFAIVCPFASTKQWEGISKLTSRIDNLDWNPWPIFCREETGDTRKVLFGEFGRYFDSVEKWSFHFGVRTDDITFWSLENNTYSGGYKVVPQPEAVAVNRQRQPIGLKFTYALHRYTRIGTYRQEARWESEAEFISGPLIYLPPPTRVGAEEAVRILLEDCCGIQGRQSDPAWAAVIAMPGAEGLDEQIREKHRAIDAVQSELAPLAAERERREALKAILYETGIQPLQEVVEATFREVGLETKPSKVSDEFVVEHEGRELLVEVKGNDKSAKLTDLRQLIDYQLHHEQSEGTPIKSALVVNAWRHLSPDQRGQKDAVIFPHNVIKRARDNNIALLDTVELYNALNAFWTSQIDGAKLFENLFNTSGVVTLVD